MNGSKAASGVSPTTYCVLQSTRETARPPSEVSLYFAFISLGVSANRVHRRVEVDAPIGRISLLAIMNPSTT